MGVKTAPHTEGLLDVGRQSRDLLKHERDKDEGKQEKTGERDRDRGKGQGLVKWLNQ